jgi:hypothetical protein
VIKDTDTTLDANRSKTYQIDPPMNSSYNKRNLVEMLGFDNISVSSMAHQDNMQMYKDAMRLGASITKLVTSFKNMQVRYKQRSFDMWKVSTILKETNRHRETTNNFNETWRTTSSYQSDCI